MLKFAFIPDDVACTSKAQTWHKPRGEKIRGQEVQTLEVVRSARMRKHNSSSAHCSDEIKSVTSTLYNPLRGQLPDFTSLENSLTIIDSKCVILPALQQMRRVESVPTKYGPCPKGSVLAVQQKVQTNYLMNIFNDVNFPKLPLGTNNRIACTTYFVPNEKQAGNLQDLSVTVTRSHKYEERTRTQSKSSLWHKLRKFRLTASVIGLIVKRQ